MILRRGLVWSPDTRCDGPCPVAGLGPARGGGATAKGDGGGAGAPATGGGDNVGAPDGAAALG